MKSADTIDDWDEAYGNAAHVRDSASYPPRWQEEAATFRAKLASTGHARIGIAYAEGPRNSLDLFLPHRTPRGVVVFIHGGYWMRFDKSFWSHLASGPLAHDFAVAMPSYTLCPDARITAITQEIGAAITAAASEIGGEIRLTGHSAGGHLATRVVTRTSPLARDVAERVTRTVSISGVHDLRPLMRTAMNQTLKIDMREALTESPALLEPVADTRLTCWVGEAELAEFRRQNALLANIWKGCGVATTAIEEPGKHHFSVVEGLADPAHPLVRALCD